MTNTPRDRCRYEWPGDCQRSERTATESGSSCCYRRTLDDESDRCVWHTAETAAKTGDRMEAHRASRAVRARNRPYAELLDGSVLSQCVLGDTVPLADTAMRGCDLVGADLENAELHGVDLTDANLRGANLRGANLKEATLIDANLRDADLTDANLGRANLTDATLYETTLARAYLTRADLASVTLESADLQQANLERADLTEAILGRANLEGATVQGATLTDARLGRADVTNANFYKADLTAAYFGRADMRGVTFEDADLSEANLGHADLVDANFRNATVSGANLGRADLTGADLGHADLSGATLENAILADAAVEHANLTGATLRRTDLTGTNFESAELSEVDLGRTDASDACFAGADLTGANLFEVTLTGTDLRDGDLSGSDLRETVIRDVTVNQGTRCGKQTRAEQAADDAPTWDAIARAYNDLKNTFSAAGLVGKARQYHVLERRARGLEAKQNGSIAAYVQFDDNRVPSFSRESGNFASYGVYVSSLASRVTTGFGVRPLRLVLWMLFLFGVATVLYEVDPAITDSVYYSVVSFTTAPPAGSEPTMPVVKVVELIETFGGTLLIVLLGYVLGNRERF